MRVLGELKADGIIKSAYRRAAGPGFYFILEGPSIDAVRERIDTTGLRCGPVVERLGGRIDEDVQQSWSGRGHAVVRFTLT
jgi:hypothetical protein